MKKAIRLSCLALTLGMAAAETHADEWRSARTAPRSEIAQSSTAGRVRLGGPIGSGRPTNVVAASYSDSATASRKSTVTVRGQSPDRGVTQAAGGEEAYNCGVVTEGPPGGSWWGNLFGHRSTCGDGHTGGGGWESDHAFDSFISPVSNPFFFEDPRALTELRIIAMHQEIPGGTPVVGGGHAQFFGLQARVAFTERWSLVMNKLGLLHLDPDIGGDETGLSDLWIGPKFTFYRDDSTNTIAAVGITAELPIGSNEVFQGDDGALSPYISAAQKVGNFHFMGTAGYRFGLQDRPDNTFVSLHADYSFFDRFYPLVELNWIHYTSNGSGPVANVEGADLFNLSATDVKGNDVVTLAGGVRFKISEAVQAGLVIEAPITSRKDLMDWRITADVIFRY